jgi:hypothetical protein
MSISILPADLTVGKPLEGLKQTIGNARRTQTSTRIPNGREDAAVEGLDKSTVAGCVAANSYPTKFGFSSRCRQSLVSQQDITELRRELWKFP